MTDHNEQENVWHIGARTLPAPGGASVELYKIVENSPSPDVTTSKQSVPKSVDEWNAVAKESDKGNEDWVHQLLSELPILVESGEIAGVNVYYVTPEEIDPKHENHLFVYLHGGANILQSGKASVVEAIYIARDIKIPVISIDYRQLPQYPFPSGLEDIVMVYQELLHHRPAQTIALGGISSGGNLTLAAVHKFIQLGLEVPGALYAGTPWSDLTKTGDSYWINEGIDRILISYESGTGELARLYAGEYDLKDQLLSPIYGNFQGFPPTFLVTGTRDLYLSNTVRVHTKLRAAGVIADLVVYEGMDHGGYFFDIFTPESRQAYLELAKFLRQHLS